MSDEYDENYPGILEGIMDFDPDDIYMDDNSSLYVRKLQDWLSDFPFSPETDKSCDINNLIYTSSCDIPINKREWLVQDALTNRARAPKLFEFLILMLGKSHYESYASFTDRSRGIFQIHKPEKVAELWQAVKSRQSNQKMTYDKFARAIRWYYKSNLMQKTNTRYTFQFSPEALRRYFIDENNNDTSTLP